MIPVLGVTEGLGWDCPAGAEATWGVLGGQLAPSTVVGVSHHAPSEEPKQAGHLVGDFWKSCLLQPPGWVGRGAP